MEKLEMKKFYKNSHNFYNEVSNSVIGLCTLQSLNVFTFQNDKYEYFRV